MRVFITGTDTNIGKTLISSWLCLHTNHTYFKPIQTGSLDETDSKIVSSISKCKTYKEIYLYKHPLSPHLAAYLENEIIDIKKINLPDSEKLIVEGAGGVLVPLNKNDYMIDLIEYLSPYNPCDKFTLRNYQSHSLNFRSFKNEKYRDIRSHY